MSNSELNFYYISNDYINFLQETELKYNNMTRVPNNIGYGNLKPYVGIVLRINEIKYYAPLTHPKMHYEENKKYFNRVSHLIQTKNENLGRIMFCYMIPVIDDALELININNIRDKEYRTLLIKQYFYISNIENSKLIISKANSLYNKVRYNRNHFLASSCCDFGLLEDYYNTYLKK